MNDLPPAMSQNLEDYDPQTQSRIKELIDQDSGERQTIMQQLNAKEPDATVVGGMGVGSPVFSTISQQNGII